MAGWALADPPVAFKDHVHLTKLGYERWADALSGGILEDYDRWRGTAR